MERITIEDVKSAVTEDEMRQVTGGGGGVPGVSRSGGGVSGDLTIGGGSSQPYLSYELENVLISSYSVGGAGAC